MGLKLAIASEVSPIPFCGLHSVILFGNAVTVLHTDDKRNTAFTEQLATVFRLHRAQHCVR